MNKEPCRYLCKETFCLLNLILICYGHPDCLETTNSVDCSLTNSTSTSVPPSVDITQTHPGSNTPFLEFHHMNHEKLGYEYKWPESLGTATPYVTFEKDLSAVQIFIIVIKVLFAVGIITCALSHYKMGARSWSDQRNRQQPSTRQLQQPCPQQQQYTYSLTPTTASMMYTPATVQERQRLEAGAHQDHLVRLHSVQTDLALNLPHSIALPDGEEGPRCDTKLLKLHDPEQHAEITRSFIRPPPNRTVPECNSLPPFRSNSVGLLQKSTTPPLTLTDPAVLVTRSHSVSSSNAHGGKIGYPRGQYTPVSNPSVSSHIWLPSSVAMNSRMSGTSGNSNRTYSCTQVVTDGKYGSNDLPPPYSDVVNQWDVNTVSRQENSGV